MKSIISVHVNNSHKLLHTHDIHNIGHFTHKVIYVFHPITTELWVAKTQIEANVSLGRFILRDRCGIHAHGYMRSNRLGFVIGVLQLCKK